MNKSYMETRTLIFSGYFLKQNKTIPQFKKIIELLQNMEISLQFFNFEKIQRKSSFSFRIYVCPLIFVTKTKKITTRKNVIEKSF